MFNYVRHETAAEAHSFHMRNKKMTILFSFVTKKSQLFCIKKLDLSFD